MQRQCGLRRLLVDWFAYHTANEWFEVPGNHKWLVTLPEFVADLVVAFAKGGACEPKDSPFETNKPNYYEEPQPAAGNQPRPVTPKTEA